jgi:hypothetical protein
MILKVTHLDMPRSRLRMSRFRSMTGPTRKKDRKVKKGADSIRPGENRFTRF